MTKIVYNADYGGFGISKEAMAEYNKRTGKVVQWSGDIERTDPVLVAIVEEMGNKANGAHAKLRIAELAVGTKYYIDEYDGWESIVTPDDIEWSVA